MQLGLLIACFPWGKVDTPKALLQRWQEIITPLMRSCIFLPGKSTLGELTMRVTMRLCEVSLAFSDSRLRKFPPPFFFFCHFFLFLFFLFACNCSSRGCNDFFFYFLLHFFYSFNTPIAVSLPFLPAMFPTIHPTSTPQKG